MNIFIMLAIFLVNIVAIALIYQFVKKLSKMDKIIFIVSSFAIIYVLVSIIYWISSFGIEKQINDAVKDFIIFIFVPINVIILIPFIAIKYSKFKAKEIQKEEFIKRLIIVGIIGIIILSVECVYFKNMKKNIKILNNNVQETTKQNNTNETNKNEIINETLTNSELEVKNQIYENVITNKNTLE